MVSREDSRVEVLAEVVVVWAALGFAGTGW